MNLKRHQVYSDLKRQQMRPYSPPKWCKKSKEIYRSKCYAHKIGPGELSGIRLIKFTSNLNKLNPNLNL